MSKWDKRFMDMAKLVASWSKDRSTKVGCVIVNSANAVLATGFNGFPRGCFDTAEDVTLRAVLGYYPQQLYEDISPDVHEQVDALKQKVEARHERPLKYKWTEHAERNAVYNAARHGVKLEDARIYLPWFPCADCMRAIIQSGIVEMICEEPDLNHPRWGADFKLGLEMAHEYGLKISYYYEPKPMRHTISEAPRPCTDPQCLGDCGLPAQPSA